MGTGGGLKASQGEPLFFPSSLVGEDMCWREDRRTGGWEDSDGLWSEEDVAESDVLGGGRLADSSVLDMGRTC